MGVNIYDIAREADTSISTVSRYLNNKNVRPDTKKRIEEVIKKYNFKPSAIAKGLVTKSLKTVAVMVVDIRMPHYASAAYFIDKELSKYGYRVVIGNTMGDINTCAEYLESVLNIGVDGVIFIGSIFNELNRYPDVVESLKNIPIVMTNGKLDVDLCKSIYIDDQAGIYNATKYLINKGRKRIKYIQYSNNSSAINKAFGYQKAMRECNLIPTVYHTNDLFKGGEEETRHILFDDFNVDGIISGEDIISMSVIRELEKNNIEVGQKCDVVGFNSSDYCNLCHPALTAVDNKIEESARLAALALNAFLNGEQDVKDINLEPALKIRESA